MILAMDRVVEVAIGEIDMERQAGEHPRIGAVDVIPFVPLGETTLDECVELARDFGARIASRFDLPVYLYAAAAIRSDRVKLADVRRGQYEGLKVEIGQDGRQPDFGPARMHPSAGAVAVGARPFLIAYNINLVSTDLELAKRIARRVRESGGGLPRVQAMGVGLAAVPGQPRLRPGLDEPARLLRSPRCGWCGRRSGPRPPRDGVELLESELIGLCPQAAMLEVADHAGFDPSAPVEDRCAAAAGYLRLRDFSPMQVLELRLAAAQRDDRLNRPG